MGFSRGYQGHQGHRPHNDDDDEEEEDEVEDNNKDDNNDKGVIVAAVEHRDGSAGSSYYSLDGLLHEVPHQIVPDRDSEYSVRDKQINHRVHEISRVIDALQDMLIGKHVTNVAVAEVSGDVSLE